MAEKTMTAETELVIDQPPSCIEICPINPFFFAVGTYKLEDSDTRVSSNGSHSATAQSRSGRIEVYQIRKRDLLSADFGIDKRCVDKYDLPDCSVLDLHFRPRDPTVFAVCTSTSEMIFFSLDGIENTQAEEKSGVSIRRFGSYHIREDKTVLATSFVWEPRSTAGRNDRFSFAVTFSTGEVEMLALQRNEGVRSAEGAFELADRAQINPAHSLEAWTVASLRLDEGERLLFTGGDDSTLTVNSIREGAEGNVASQTQIFRDRKCHAAGVTAILPIFDAAESALSKTTIYLTGSYDEHVRIFTVQNGPPHRRELAAELRLEGGVWRLKTMSEPVREKLGGVIVNSVLVLASCMHAGIRIIRISFKQAKEESRHETPFDWNVEVVGSFTKGHNSMCYGADCVPSKSLLDDGTGTNSSKCRSQSLNSEEDPRRGFVVTSTSFYDRKICIWNSISG